MKVGGEKETCSLTISLHMVELCPHGTDIHEILYRRFLPKSQENSFLVKI
jgi:hypothetical protein